MDLKKNSQIQSERELEPLKEAELMEVRVSVENTRLKRIEERAYAIWLDEGQCHDRDQEHWRQAEREIDGEIR